MYGLNAVRVMFTSTSSAIATSRRRITSTVTGSSAAATCAFAGSVAAVNVDLLEPADRERVARSDQGARSVFLDQCGAVAGESDRQSIAVEHRGPEELVFFEKEDRPLAWAPRLRVRVAIDEPRQLRPRHVQRGERMQRHELGLRGRIGVAVAARVFAVECLPQRRRVVARRKGDLERVLLPFVA